MKRQIEEQFSKLHPTKEAEAYRDLESWAGKRAQECEERNERVGVPDPSELDDDGDYLYGARP